MYFYFHLSSHAEPIKPLYSKLLNPERFQPPGDNGEDHQVSSLVIPGATHGGTGYAGHMFPHGAISGGWISLCGYRAQWELISALCQLVLLTLG